MNRHRPTIHHQDIRLVPFIVIRPRRVPGILDKSRRTRWNIRQGLMSTDLVASILSNSLLHCCRVSCFCFIRMFAETRNSSRRTKLAKASRLVSHQVANTRCQVCVNELRVPFLFCHHLVSVSYVFDVESISTFFSLLRTSGAVDVMLARTPLVSVCTSNAPLRT